MRRRASIALLASLMLLVSCTGGGEESRTPSPSPEYWHGGTLRVVGWGLDAKALDPKQYWYDALPSAIFRCCLLRTLLSYTGKSTAEAGTELHPDLATDLPEVSADGLVWTFNLKGGLRYAPPFDDVEIVAADVVRALERRAEPWDSSPDWGGGYRFYYSVIEGFDDYWAGEAEHVSGLETPDDHTLVVRLREPAGDLGNLFAMPATAPIPEGAADGHVRDYGRFLVASGPYMIEGSEDLDFSLPPKEQQPASGFVPGEWGPWSVHGTSSLMLVRNPSWDPSTDRLRPAYPERIEFTLLDMDLGGDRETHDRLTDQVESAEIDFDLMTRGGPWIRRHPTDRVFRDTWDSVTPMIMNLAVPPSDDLHVRKAVALAIDRASIERELEDDLFYPGELIDHVAPNGVEGGLLTGWAPEWLSDPSGDVQAAEAEMRLSRYDHDGDGRCDDPACQDVRALVYEPSGPDESASYSWRAVREALAEIGLRFDATIEGYVDWWQLAFLPDARWGLYAGSQVGWIADFPNGSTFFTPLLSGEAVQEGYNLNMSMLGATRKQLEGWGYPVTEVPSVDDRIDRCMELMWSEQTECWADLDRYLMEEVVPWVPLLETLRAFAVSPRVAHYSFDQSTGLPAFDQIALAEGSE